MYGAVVRDVEKILALMEMNVRVVDNVLLKIANFSNETHSLNLQKRSLIFIVSFQNYYNTNVFFQVCTNNIVRRGEKVKLILNIARKYIIEPKIIRFDVLASISRYRYYTRRSEIL